MPTRSRGQLSLGNILPRRLTHLVVRWKAEIDEDDRADQQGNPDRFACAFAQVGLPRNVVMSAIIRTGNTSRSLLPADVEDLWAMVRADVGSDLPVGHDERRCDQRVVDRDGEDERDVPSRGP